MHLSPSTFLAFCIATAVPVAQAALTSTATIPRREGAIIFELYDDPAMLAECSGRNDMGAIARIQSGGKVLPYGTGCWSAGGDGFITLKIKSLDDGSVRTNRIHNSEFKPASARDKGGKAQGVAEQMPWEFSKAVGDRGTPVCALSTDVKVGEGNRSISIKAFAKRDHLNITLHDTRWKFKAGSWHKATIDFDDKKPLQVEAYGDGSLLFADLPTQATAIFLGLVAERQTLRVAAPGDDLVAVNLRGIAGPLRQFVDCARAFK